MSSSDVSFARVAALFASYIPVGIATTMLGPLLPGLQKRWHIGDSQAGLLFTAQFVVSIISAPAVAPLAKRWGYFGLIWRGLLLVAGGAAGCAVASWPWALLAAAAWGVGLGVVIPTANFALAALNPGGSARAVLWLNATWSVGAMLAAVCVAVLGGAFLWSLAAAALGFAILIAVVCRSNLRPTERGWAGDIGDAPYALLLFLYVGAETALAGWISSYALRSGGAEGLWAALPSVFWGAVLGGRALAGPALRRARPETIVMAGLACGFGGAALLIGGGGAVALAAAAAISGLGFAPIFPLIVAQYADRHKGGTASALVFVAAGLGGAAVPLLVGEISDRTGNLRLGLCLVLVCIVAMLWLQMRLAQKGQHP